MAETQGNPPPNGGQGTDPPEGSEKKYVTEEQLNRAITARFTDHEKKFGKKLDEFGQGLLSKIDETWKPQLEALKPKDPAAPPQPAGGAPAGENKAAPIHEDPEFKRMQREMKALQEKAEASSKREAEARSKSRDQALRSRLGDELGKHGIAGPRAKLAAGALIDSLKSVAYDGDSEEILFTAPGAEPVDISAGIASWAKSEDAQIFIAPRGTQGSGDSARGGTTRTNPNDPRANLKAAITRLANGE